MASNVPDDPGAQGEASIKSKIEGQREKLEEIVDSESGLLDKLLKKKALTHPDTKKIEAEKTTYDRNKLLLDLIFKKDKHQQFIAALEESGQKHVINWINGNGGYRVEFGLDWPLTEREIGILDDNSEELVDTLNVDGEFLGKLFSQKIINKRQRDFIDSQTISSNRNVALLDFLRQSSLETYFQVARSLRTLTQGHVAVIFEGTRQSNRDEIANVLDNGGVIVPVHATFEEQNKEEVERRVVQEVTRFLFQNLQLSEETEVGRLMAKVQLNIIATLQGNSIVLYLCCREAGEFHRLCTIVENDELRDVLEQLFNLLLQNLPAKVLLVTITEADREKAAKSFERESRRDKTFDEHFRTLRSQLKCEKQEEREKEATAAVIVKVVHEQTENIVEIEEEIVAKLNQLQDRNSPKSEDVWRFLSQLKVGGLEILSARQERGGVVVWLGCRSDSVITKLEDLNKSEKLGHLFSALFQLLVSTNPKISEISLEKTGFDFANQTHHKWSVKTSATMGALKISGVALLDNKIYTVFQNRNAILLFSYDKEGDTVPEKEEPLKEIETPMHMVCSPKSRCLYITDRSNFSIWKINIGDQGKLDEPKEWLDGSKDEINSLSIGRNDDVLVLRQAKPCRLEIYNAEGNVEEPPLVLPDQLVNPHHASEASNGDFVISYSAETTPDGICRITRDGQWISRLDLGFKINPIANLSTAENSILASLSEGMPYLKYLDHFTLYDDDRVYVCDADRYIVQLDSELNMESIVEVADLTNPYRIHYLKEEKGLLVVHGSGQNSFSVLEVK